MPKIYKIYLSEDESDKSSFFTNKALAISTFVNHQRHGAEPTFQESDLMTELEEMKEVQNIGWEIAGKLLSAIEDYFSPNEQPEFYKEIEPLINKLK
jgi:hypothetical protein